MRFVVLARVVVAAASVTLVTAATLERREPGICSSPALGSTPFCGSYFGTCSGDGCKCRGLGGLGILGSVLNVGVSAHKV